MKLKILLLLFFSIFAYKGFSQSGWVEKNLGLNNLVSINFINSSTGYIFRSDKYLFKTTNNGLTWDSTLMNTLGIFIRQGMFINENYGAHMPYPSITTNGGTSWNQSLPPFNGSLDVQKMYLYNQTTAYISGIDVDIFDLPVDPVIYKTTNSGISWFEVDRGGGANNYSDIIFINDNTGFECRFTIKKTTDAGNTWFPFTMTGRQRTKFSKVFNDTMYMSSANGYVAKSTNLGANWTEYHTGVNQLLTDIYFVDNRLGYVIGDTGAIVKTTNGGVNWSIQNSGTTRRLNEVWFLNKDTGFIAGDSGLLLVTYNGGLTSLIQNNQSIPEKFKLYQNYPNPFNPSTVIKFDIAKSSNVRLSVYDINGKEMSNLVNGHLQPGSYEYRLDGGGLPSGVYFYKLDNGNIVETKRMVLLK